MSYDILNRNFILLLILALTAVCGAAPAAAQAAAEEPLPVQGTLSDEEERRDQAFSDRIKALIGEGKVAEATEQARAKLELRRTALGDDDPLTLEAIHDLGALLGGDNGKYAEAEPLLRQALAGWQTLLGDDHPRTFRAMSDLGYTLECAGRLTEAEPLLREALDGRRRVLGNDNPETLTSIDYVGLLLFDMGRLEEAESFYREALDRARLVLGEDHLDTLMYINNMGFLLQQMGRLEEAGGYYQEALDDRKRILGPDHPHTLITLNNLAALLLTRALFAEAEPMLREAVTGYERTVGSEHPYTLYTTNNLALVLRKMGRYAEAEQWYRKALDICRRTLGENHPRTMTLTSNLGALLTNRGRMAEAELLLLGALEGRRRLLGNDHPNTLTTLGNLATMLWRQGRHDEAWPLVEAAVEGKRRSLGRDHQNTLASVEMLSMFDYADGRLEEAERGCRDVLADRRRLLGDDHLDTLSSLNNLGQIVQKQGRLDEAETLYREALAGHRRSVGPDNPQTLISLSNVGQVLFSRGRPEEAEPLVRRALETRRSVLGPNHPKVLVSANLLAEVLAGQGDDKAAEKVWTEAAEVYEIARLQSSGTVLDRAYVDEKLSPLAPLTACLARNSKPLQAWQRYEENLARGLLDIMSARHCRPLEPGERDVEDDLLGRLQRCDEAMGALSRSSEAEQGAERTRLREERDTLQLELVRFQAKLSTKYGATAGEVYNLPRIQSALPENAAIIGWVDVDGGDHWGCVIRREGQPAWIRLPGGGKDGAWTDDDDALAGRVGEILGRVQRRSAARRNQQLFQRLRTQRIDPLHSQLAGVEQLIVLPAGVMAGIPVEVLAAEYTVSYAPSGTMYTWLREKDRHPQSRATGDPPLLLALGDPAFEAVAMLAPVPAEPPDHGLLVTLVLDDKNAYRGGVREGDVLLAYDGERLAGPDELGPAVAKRKQASTEPVPAEVPITVWREGEELELSVAPGKLGLRPEGKTMPEALLEQRELDRALGPARHQPFEPLPGSRHEVETIAGLFRVPDRERGNEILLGRAASERRLESLSAEGRLKQFGVIHLATHGVMNDRMAMQSALILAREEDPVAGASGAVYDGRLTGEQIVRTWKLDADLVTLSGCETALGRKSGGEGYLGFSQAMFVAGARSLLLSLWKVNDLATMLLMERFYGNLLGKFGGVRSVGERHYASGQPLPRAEALREAKVWLSELTGKELRALDLDLSGKGMRGADQSAETAVPAAADRPFADPHFWAAFVLLGDPG